MSVRPLIAAMVLFGVWGSVSLAVAQKRAPAAPRRSPNRASPKPAAKGAQNPAKELERFQKMSPQDRQKALAKLPPDRRARMEKQLSRYENLTPAQQAQVNRRLQKFQSLPPQRQNAVRQELQHLRAMPPAQRRAVLNSDQESRRFSPDELQLLRESSGQPNRF